MSNSPDITKRRRQAETGETAGLLLIIVSLLLPLAGGIDRSIEMIRIARWIYSAGALIFVAATCIPVNGEDDSLRLRRLRRLEFWAGMAFAIGAFFWWYNSNKYGLDSNGGLIMVGPLAIIRDTIMFSMVGAVIHLIASWMIAFRIKKEQKDIHRKK